MKNNCFLLLNSLINQNKFQNKIKKKLFSLKKDLYKRVKGEF